MLSVVWPKTRAALTSPPMMLTHAGWARQPHPQWCSPWCLRKNVVLQCTGFTLGSLQFSERVLWESFNTSYFEASPRPKVPGGSYTSGLIRCLAARKPLIDRHYLTPDVLRDWFDAYRGAEATHRPPLPHPRCLLSHHRGTARVSCRTTAGPRKLDTVYACRT